jgi:hypothetical protein
MATPNRSEREEADRLSVRREGRVESGEKGEEAVVSRLFIRHGGKVVEGEVRLRRWRGSM